MKTFLLSLCLGMAMAAGCAFAAPIDKSRIHIVDGDTIRIDNKRPDIQLLGFDAPEIRGARCDTELDLGAKTARRLRTIIQGSANLALDFTFVACPCRKGMEGTAYCSRGRRCGILKVSGKNVGDILIAEKLVVPLVCDADRCSPSHSWCRRAAGR